MVSPTTTLVLFSVAMIFLPIGGYFLTKELLFEGSAMVAAPGVDQQIMCLVYFVFPELLLPSHISSSSLVPGMLGYKDGSVGSAITAVLLVHVVIAGYIYVAWKEGSTTVPTKQE